MSLLRIIKTTNRFIVVCAQDSAVLSESTGPIVMECMLDHSSLQDAINSQFMYQRYGENIVCKLEPLSEDDLYQLLGETEMVNHESTSTMFKEILQPIMADLAISKQARLFMIIGNHEKAIKLVREMNDKLLGVKFEALILEHKLFSGAQSKAIKVIDAIEDKSKSKSKSKDKDKDNSKGDTPDGD